MKTKYTLTAAFTLQQPVRLEFSADLSQQRAFHAAGNDEPLLQERRLIVLSLEFKAPHSAMFPEEIEPDALTAAQRLMTIEINAKYPNAGSIKWNIETPEKIS